MSNTIQLLGISLGMIGMSFGNIVMETVTLLQKMYVSYFGLTIKELL